MSDVRQHHRRPARRPGRRAPPTCRSGLHLAKVLAEAGRDADAEAEFRAALTQIQAAVEERPADAGL